MRGQFVLSSSGAVQYAHNVAYGVGKAALDKIREDVAPWNVPIPAIPEVDGPQKVAA